MQKLIRGERARELMTNGVRYPMFLSYRYYLNNYTESNIIQNFSNIL